VVAEVLGRFGQVHRRQLETSGDALIECGEHAEAELTCQCWLADQQQCEREGLFVQLAPLIVPRSQTCRHRITPMIHMPITVNSIGGVHNAFTQTGGNGQSRIS
jgi:hypothetical protein